YRSSRWVAEDLTDAPRAFQEVAPMAGDRAPIALSGLDWVLLGFCGTDGRLGTTRWRARLEGAAAGYPIRVQLVDDPRLHERFGLRGPGVYLVRPDGHVAFRSAGERADPVARYLDRIWIRPTA